MVGAGGGPCTENADERKELHWMEGPPLGHPFCHTMPPPCPGSLGHRSPGNEKQQEDLAVEMRREGYRDEKCRETQRQPSRPGEVGQGPPIP